MKKKTSAVVLAMLIAFSMLAYVCIKNDNNQDNNPPDDQNTQENTNGNKDDLGKDITDGAKDIGDDIRDGAEDLKDDVEGKDNINSSNDTHKDADDGQNAQADRTN